MHTRVPGADGHPGFGGACLPKDTEACARWTQRSGVDASAMRAVLDANARQREDA